MNASHGSSPNVVALVDAAVGAAVDRKAPRRTVAAVAAAAVQACLQHGTCNVVGTQEVGDACEGGGAQRRRKGRRGGGRRRRRDGNAAASPSTRAPAEHGVSQAVASSSRSSAPVESAVLQGVSTCALAATNMPQTGSMVAPAKQGMPQASRNHMGSTRAPAEHGTSQAGVKQSKGDGHAAVASSPAPKESALQQGVSSCAPAETSMSQSGSTPAPAEHGMSRKRAPAEQGMPQAAERQPQEVAATAAQSVSSASNDSRDQWVARETEKPRAQKPKKEDAELQRIKEDFLAAARARMAKQRQ